MLDAETKRKIDNARDILVGKVPDPKSQVDQITIALIYKFMDDMDQEAEELGGKTKFFTGEFEKYTWSKLMDSKLGGQERLDLYAMGIQKMNQNKNIPQLFRDIFKDAFLPYRDPETLNLFLKEINNFTYDHSEQLGNAFEYLLSVMGSQGKAGQFRTPRHIIEFIVDVVDPDKDDTILDPACGTAGFLISAYKHILEKHTKKDKLTPDQRERLTRNFTGYDISPDMVRLSLVNMYLHKFPTPQIYEYDTLSSEERWGDRFDVIMTNPPFMTPKGGIRPHKRFAIQANRAELLFVDYIAEHLTPHGRAGIIVPEGIIFQSSNAYKNLRKMLVENGYLWAVASLPAGIFNPYSGVKTSILFLNKNIAKSVKHILFVKVGSDGFDLGAQRRPVISNDLPMATEALVEYRKHVLSGGKLSKTGWPSIAAVDTNPLCQFVSKKEIAKSGDYNLSGDRYREIITYDDQKWPILELGGISEVSAGNSAPQDKKLFENGKWPFCRTSDVGKAHISSNFKDIDDYLNEGGIRGLKLFPKGTILFPKSGASTFLNHRAMLVINSYVSSHLATIKADTEKILDKFLFYLLLSVDAKSLTSNQNYPSLKLSEIKRVRIPLPPLEVQKQIVEKLDGYQKIIDGAKQVIENWKPYIQIDPEWEMVGLDSISKMVRGPFGGSLKKDIFVPKGPNTYKVYQQGNVIKEEISFGDYYIYAEKYEEMQRFALRPNDILTTCSGTMGRTLVVPEEFEHGVINQALLKITPDVSMVRPEYLNLVMNTPNVQNHYFDNTSGAIIQNVGSMKVMRSIKIPLPPLEVQKQIVAQIEAEKALVDSNKELITLYEEKIKDKIKEVWGSGDK